LPVSPETEAAYERRELGQLRAMLEKPRATTPDRQAAREAWPRMMPQQVNAPKLKVTWMSEEEKAAYRLRDRQKLGRTLLVVYDPISG
jgi:hypothetical protein